jgi:putative transposase
MLYIRFPLSPRNVEALLHERGIEISHQTVRYWWNRFGPMFAVEIRANVSGAMRAHRYWRWHLDEIYVKINDVTHCPLRLSTVKGRSLKGSLTRRATKAAFRSQGNR